MPSAVLRRTVLVALLLASALPGRAEDYEIRFVRPAKAGDHYAVAATGSRELRVGRLAGGAMATLRDEVVAATLSATAEVLAVTADGRETRNALTVTASAVTRAGATAELLPVGTVITADGKGPKTTFTIAGAPATPEVAQALEVLIREGNPEGRNEDEVFGSATRRAVGDSWPVDAAAATADMTRYGQVQFAPSDLTGETTLLEVVPGGVPALRIGGTMAVAKLVVPLPPGLTLTRGSFSARYAATLPVDVSRRSVGQSLTLESRFEWTDPAQGADATMGMVIKEVTERTFSN